MKPKLTVLHFLVISIFLFLSLSWHMVSAVSPTNEILSNIHYVKSGADGDCSSWTTACHLQTALSVTTSGDEIWVAAGTYKPTSTNDRYISFEMISGVAIYGGFPSAGGNWETRDWENNITTLSGDIGILGDINDNSINVVRNVGVDDMAILDGFIITDGNASGSGPIGENYHSSGGGMYNSSSNPTIRNVTFTNNSAYNGGGMYNENNSNPLLLNITFLSNSAGEEIGEGIGGGMHNDFSSNPTIIKTNFLNNTSANGGGMFGGGTLRNVTFSGNTAVSGGGMSLQGFSNISLENITFYNNSADNGGGISMRHSDFDRPTVTLTNVTFSGNSAGIGGGIDIFETNLNLYNVTLFENVASGGGGISFAGGGSLIINNSIVWANLPDQISGDANATYSIIQGVFTGTGNINEDPLLGNLAKNGGVIQTHALLAGSPAIDNGDPNFCPEADQRGYMRPFDGDNDTIATCDIGAFEYGSYLIHFNLMVNKIGNGLVSINPEKPYYISGEEVTITATPHNGWNFEGWSGDVISIENPLTVMITDDTTIIATFAENYQKFYLPMIIN